MSKIKSQMSIKHNKSGNWATLFKIKQRFDEKNEFANIDRRTDPCGLGWFKVLSNHYHYKQTLINYQHDCILKKQCNV